MKLYAHKVIVQYLDYGSLLEFVTMLGWSLDGQRVVSTEGYNDFDARYARKLAMLAQENATLGRSDEIVLGAPVTRRCDMNPHGLI